MQDPTSEFDPPHRHSLSVMTFFGPMVMVLGVVLALIGLYSFFSSLETLEPPTYLWAVMVGLPLVGVGASFAKFGRDETILRDLAKEVSPEARAPLKTAATATRYGVEPSAQAAELGLATGTDGDGSSDLATACCGRCHAANPLAAKFCNQCGTSLLSQTCPGCGASISPSARFCTQCGKLVG